jgi:hypothetical protein
MVDAVVKLARRQEPLSDERFTVDAASIEAWASMKSFRPKQGGDAGAPNDRGNPAVDFTPSGAA